MLWSTSPNATPVPLSVPNMVPKHPPNPYDTNQISAYIPHRWPPLRAHPPSKGLQQTVGVVNSTSNRPTVELVPLGLGVGGGVCLVLFIVLYGEADLLLYVGLSAVSAVGCVRVFDYRARAWSCAGCPPLDGARSTAAMQCLVSLSPLLCGWLLFAWLPLL